LSRYDVICDDAASSSRTNQIAEFLQMNFFDVNDLPKIAPLFQDTLYMKYLMVGLVVRKTWFVYLQITRYSSLNKYTIKAMKTPKTLLSTILSCRLTYASSVKF